MGSQDRARANSFDALRLLAALAVIFHHVRPVAGLAPIRLFSTDFGQLGVGVFFVISGFLVTVSWRRSARAGDYLKKRLLRIEPALIASVAITALVLGAAVTTLPLADYFQRREVWLYVARNALMYPVTYSLPGVFEHNPMPGIVNASLWTLRLEFTGYLALMLLGILGVLRVRIVAALALVAAATALVLHVAAPQLQTHEPLRLIDLGALNGFLFLAGAVLQLRDRPTPLWAVAISALLLPTPLWFLGLPAVTVAIGALRSPRLPGDISYGLYVWAFPLQQILAASGCLSFGASVLATAPLAAASWWLIEKPALRLKPKRGGNGANDGT